MCKTEKTTAVHSGKMWMMKIAFYKKRRFGGKYRLHHQGDKNQRNNSEDGILKQYY
jgi:hypothetical protein